MRTSPIEIRTSPGGIEMKENGSALILMHTRGQQTADYRKYAGILAGPVCRSGHWSGHDQ